MYKAKVLEVLGYVAMFCVGGLAYTHVISQDMATAAAMFIALVLPTPLAKLKAGGK